MVPTQSIKEIATERTKTKLLETGGGKNRLIKNLTAGASALNMAVSTETFRGPRATREQKKLSLQLRNCSKERKQFTKTGVTRRIKNTNTEAMCLRRAKEVEADVSETVLSQRQEDPNLEANPP